MIRAAAHELRLVALALQYFTRLPTPRLARFEPTWLSQAVRWFPLAGFVVGVIAAVVLWLAARALPWPIACALALAASVAVTGAFHEDGLADTFDALGGHVDRERALAIMRDSRIGTYGAAALVFGLLLRWQSLASMSPALALTYLLTMHAAARAGAALLMAGLPYIRIDADAKAKPVAQPMGTRQAFATVLIGLLPTLVAACVHPAAAIVLLAGLAGIAIAHLACRRWYRRRLGGYTGDGLGAAEQIGEVAAALAMLAVATVA